MTTRLLASFNVLDSHSKIALDRHARKNQLLCQMPMSCYMSCQEPDKYLSHNCDLDLDFPSARRTPISKTKTISQIIGEDQLILNNKIRVFMSNVSKPTSPTFFSRKGLSCTPSHSTVSIRPFTSPENRDRSPEQRKDQESDSESFAVITRGKNRLSLKTTNQLPQRPKWSKELKRVPQLGLERENSLAQVGGALGYTDTSRWCSFPLFRDAPLTAVTEEEKDKFSLSASVGKVVSHQLQQGNVVRVWTSEGPKKQCESTGIEKRKEELSKNGDKASAEAVPLSFTDELERKSVKIITLKTTLSYTPLPIVSTTYPVMCSSDPNQYKPFSTPGFPSVCHPDRGTSGRTVKSAIVHITDSLPVEAILKARKEKEQEERKSLLVQREHTLETNTVNLKVLSADRRVLKDTDVGQLLLRESCQPPCPAAPPPAGKDAPVSLVALNHPLRVLLKQTRGSSDAVGPVLNGMNPKHGAASASPPEYFKPLPWGNRKKIPAISTPVSSVRNPVTSQSIKKGYMFISKPLKRNESNVNQFVKKRQPNKDWYVAQLKMFDNYLISQAVEKQCIGVHKASFFLRAPDRRNECIAKYQGCFAVNRLPLLKNSYYSEQPPPTPTIYLSDQESLSDSGAEQVYTCKTKKSPFDPQAVISIPTAENMLP